jgi:predicted MFS family arabinose efflux permease
MTAGATDTAAAGTWSPLRVPMFRAMWLAILASNIGTWMHDVAAAWMMAEATDSALMVAAVQSATTLPVVLLALFAGALADSVDRRRYLMLTQAWMLLVAATLAALAWSNLLGPWTLLALTFALGCGAAMAMPAQAATTSELVPRALLPPAVALASISMNIARSIGPALGGVVVARAGASWAFALNAVSFLCVVIVLWRWRRTPDASRLPRETLRAALRSGLRYAAHAQAFRAVLFKAASFFAFASALPALLPTFVRHTLHAEAGLYGVLLACIGVGALAGALLLPRLRAQIERDRLVLLAALGQAACIGAVAITTNTYILCGVMLLNGATWITVLSSFQIAAQTSVPGWVRARALSLYIVVFALGMGAGSLVWGVLAQQAGVSTALLVAAVMTAVAALWAHRFKLGLAEALDLAPSAHWPQPIVAAEPAGERGPVLVTIEYRVAADWRAEFDALMPELGRSRRRDGAVQWGVLEDVAQPDLMLEYFFVASWLDHLRQHDRVTGEERRLQDRVRALLVPGQAPQVRHFAGPVAPFPRGAA